MLVKWVSLAKLLIHIVNMTVIIILQHSKYRIMQVNISIIVLFLNFILNCKYDYSNRNYSGYVIKNTVTYRTRNYCN